MTKRKTIDLPLLSQYIAEGADLETIAARLRVKPKSVVDMVRKAGLPSPPKAKPGPRPRTESAFTAKLKSLWAQQMPVLDIAKKLGVGRSTVRYTARALGLVAYKTARRQAEQPPPHPAIEERKKPVQHPAGMMGDLIASRGRWRALSAIAAKRGMTYIQVQQEYHRARAGK